MPPGRVVLVALAVLLVAGVALLAVGEDDDGDRDRTLTAAGLAERRVMPDLATLRLGVVARDADPRAAVETTSAALRRVLAAVREAGADEIETEPVRLDRPPRPRPDGGSQPQQPQQPQPHVARQAISVRLRDPALPGRVIEAAVRAGATEVDGPRWTLADPAAERRRTLAAAVEDARASARAMADAAGVTLGEPQAIAQENGGGGVPVLRDGATAAGAVPPTERGPITVSARVRVAFAVEEETG